MKEISSLLLCILSLVVVCTSCFNNSITPTNPTVPSNPVTVLGVASVCGTTANTFRLNTMRFDGNCYTLGLYASGVNQQYWIYSLTTNINNSNYVLCTVYLKGRPYDDKKFALTDSPDNLTSDNAMIEIIDATNGDAYKRQYLSTAGSTDSVWVEVDANGVQSVFNDVKIYNASSNQTKYASANIKQYVGN